MKHGRKPTAAQRKLLQKHRLDPAVWLVVKDLPHRLELVHRLSDKTLKFVPKGELKCWDRRKTNMATEKRLIDANLLAKDLELLAKHEDSFRQSVILGVVRTIKAQPTVDAALVVHGRWIPTYHTYYNKDGACQIADEWHCSECDIYSRVQTRYCPNCGARMDGGNQNG